MKPYILLALSFALPALGQENVTVLDLPIQLVLTTDVMNNPRAAVVIPEGVTGPMFEYEGVPAGQWYRSFIVHFNPPFPGQGRSVSHKGWYIFPGRVAAILRLDAQMDETDAVLNGWRNIVDEDRGLESGDEAHIVEDAPNLVEWAVSASADVDQFRVIVRLDETERRRLLFPPETTGKESDKNP